MIPEPSRLPTDLAVLEQRYGDGEYRVLVYIGPRRQPAHIPMAALHRGMSIRIRYLEELSDEPEALDT